MNEEKNTTKNDKKYFENKEIVKDKEGLDKFLEETKEKKANETNENRLTEEQIKKIKKKERLARMQEFNEWFICIIIAIVLAFVIKFFIGTFTTVKQTSMYPTFKDGDRLWLSRIIRTFNGEYKRGDIVTLEAPKSENINVNNKHPKAVYDVPDGFLNNFKHYFLEIEKISLIKRIIALPGERVEIKNGEIYINDKKLDEPYLKNDIKTDSVNLDNFIVPENHFFVLGDNRPSSSDSRTFGCIPEDKLEGRIKFYMWPFSKFGIIDKNKKVEE